MVKKKKKSSDKNFAIKFIFIYFLLIQLEDKEYRAAHTEGRGLCLLSSKEAISLWLLAARKVCCWCSKTLVF